MTDIELKEFLQDLEKEPTNLDLINQIALGFLETPSMQTNDEEKKYFELAYSTGKTVKSIHNLAWYLYFECGEQEKAIEMQKECIVLQPKSYYPYYQFGYMLQDSKRYKEAIPFLDKAYNIEQHRDIIHNIGCCYFQIGEFQKAKKLFSQSTTELDIENKSLYNLALSEWKLNNVEQVKFIADKLSKDITTNVQKSIDGYEIGLLYFLLEDFERASECLVKQGLNGIDLFDWTDLSYSLFMTDNKLWKDKINDSIDKRKKWCDEIKGNHEGWSEYTNEEKQERLTDLKAEIKFRLETLNNGMTKPIQDLSKSIREEYCDCLLFDCKSHNNKNND